MKPKGKLKIPAIKVLADDCNINIGQVMEDGETINPGTSHHVHVDEWIEVMPVIAVKEVMQLSRLQRAGEESGTLGESLEQLCRELSKRIITWNWTDMMGAPLAQPYQTPEVIMALTVEEVMYLIQAASGQESPDERKNGSGPSAVTSSAAAPSPVSQS